MSLTTQTKLSPGLLILMAAATGLSVAGNYFAQPLLHTISLEFALSETEASHIITTAQLSYGAGLLLLVPLADLFERRRLIIVMTLLAALGLTITGSAHNQTLLLVGTAITGLSSVVAQVLVPFAATLAAPEQRGRAVGQVMSGLMIGILLARTVSGGLSSLLDWRAVYWFSGVLMLLCAIALRCNLPKYHAEHPGHYLQLLSSMFRLFATEKKLQQRCLLGALSFALFSLFWTPLAFLLAVPPYSFSDATIGFFGLAGAAGAAAAIGAGHLVDSGKGALATRLGLVTLLLSWLILGYAPTSLGALIIGILFLDLAIQLVHVCNQNIIFGLYPEKRNRLNAIYMTWYFVGGSFGSWLAATLYPVYQWQGITLVAVIIASFGAIAGFCLRES